VRQFLRSFYRREEDLPVVRQSGALPYALAEGRVVFLLVTSRKTGRWIFPKGSISAGLTPWDSAAKEAMEEAGVIGPIEPVAICSYVNLDKDVPVTIDLYPMLVESQLNEWKEKGQRLRHWVLLEEARRLLGDRGLVSAVETLHSRLSASRG
jgi:8-oxo-dGTP pyrophosphatase MutT (NUDIX family)